jgi:transcriptional antiterminator NusG|tara:strand:- start:621 stop:1199 length:579 start_codon:yes stop_codon:yes gene_type:complete
MSETVSINHRWYAVQCLSNHEDKVRRFLTRFREDDENFSKHLKEILVPIETVSEVKNGQKKQRDRKFYPGYVFVEMHLFDTEGNLIKEPWYKVKDTDGVINFIGRANPTALREDEIGRILRQVEEAKGKEVPKVQFELGQVVKILDGPFINLTGDIEEIDAEKGSLKISVSIFGRFTPVELEFWQVEKADET